jgi:hypothetical protein
MAERSQLFLHDAPQTIGLPCPCRGEESIPRGVASYLPTIEARDPRLLSPL